MSGTVAVFWGKLSFLGKLSVSILALGILFWFATKVFDNRPFKIENFYPEARLAESELLKIVPLGSLYNEVSQVLKQSNIDFIDYGEISEINPRNLADYKTKDHRAYRIAIHGTDWSDYFNGKYRVWAKVITEYDEDERLVHVEIFFGALNLEWAI